MAKVKSFLVPEMTFKQIFPYVFIILLISVFMIWKIYKGNPEPEALKSKPEVIDPTIFTSGDKANWVQAQMKNVDFRVDSGTTLHIQELRGELIPTQKNGYPVFNKKESFILEIHSAVISMDVKSLSSLLNGYVFGYKDSPLKNLKVNTAGNQLKQEGDMKGLPFTIFSDISVTPEGKIWLHPIVTKVIGINVGGLMKFFKVALDDLIKINGGHGATVVENDFYLDPALMLPPPHIKGHLKSIRVAEGKIIMTFSSVYFAPLKPDSANANYMYFNGGRLGFGNLTMYKADMQIIDSDPKDPFDFYLDHYFEQLTAGYHKTTQDDGLIIWMPDYNDMKK